MSYASPSNGSSATSKPVRDANGRFVKGNPGGPGNPFARKVAALRKALVNFVTVDDMKHVAFILKEKAMAGDLVAIKLLFQYVLGKPGETVDPDRVDIEEANLQDEHYEAIEEPAMLAEMYAGPAAAEADDEEDRDEDAEDEPDEREDEPSQNGDDSDHDERRAEMRQLVQRLVRTIAAGGCQREVESLLADGQNDARPEEGPSPDGGNGHPPGRRRN